MNLQLWDTLWNTRWWIGSVSSWRQQGYRHVQAGMRRDAITLVAGCRFDLARLRAKHPKLEKMAMRMIMVVGQGVIPASCL